jgi:hypothetical protein
MMGPLGLLAPHPGVSYLFDSGDSEGGSGGGVGGSLWGIANASLMGMGVGISGGHGSAISSPPPNWNNALGEMVLKIDGKFKVCIFI